MSEAFEPSARILIVEDEADQRELVARILEGRGCTVRQSGSAEEAAELLEGEDFDLVLSDWKLPGEHGIWLLGKVRERQPGAAFVLATAYGSISHAVEAVRQGADDYLEKPFRRQVLLLAVERALRSRSLREQNRRLTEALGERDRLVDLIGRAPVMQKLYRRIEKVAGTAATVLITGESGTGKELAARALHALSPRRESPFVVLDCAAIPEGLMEAELFGAEKGAYTGAEQRRTGKFEAADGGTLFLDEVGELPLNLQPKLLRALQEGRFSRVGSSSEIEVDVRIVAATNRDLTEAVGQGGFRSDLYYRLNVVPVRMPALRERREDVAELIEHFRREAARRHGVASPRFGKAVLERLVDHSWPGNVRPLRNVVERLVLLADESGVGLEDLPEELATTEGAVAAGGLRLPEGGIRWDDHERSLLEQALEQSGGNRARAARLLGLPYKAFLYRLRKHGVSAD